MIGPARLKRRVRAAISQCGGLDGAAATAERKRSVVGDWNNLNHQAFPPLDCALALDEAAVAMGLEPQIVTGLARELGGVFVPLPDAAAEPGSLAAKVMELTARVGALNGEMAQMLGDGVIDASEARRLLELEAEIDQASAELRLALEHLAGDPDGPGAVIRMKKGEH